MALAHSRMPLLVEGSKASKVNSDRETLLSCSLHPLDRWKLKMTLLLQAFCAQCINICRRSPFIESVAQLHHQKHCASRRQSAGVQCDSLRSRAEQASAVQNSSAAALDAIVVLGGGLTASGGIPLWGQRRLDTAHQLYSKQGMPCLEADSLSSPQYMMQTSNVPTLSHSG